MKIFVDGDGSPVKETVIEKIIQKMSLLCMLIKERMLLILKLCS